MASERPEAHGAGASISVLITDLDNTLWDWVDLWYRAFKPMLDRLVADSGLPEEQLEREVKAVHERHGTSEYAFLIQELPSLQLKHPGKDLRAVYQKAIDTYRDERNRALALYPDVLETLEVLKDKGCLIVGYTESRAYYTEYRLRKLGLDRVLDFLYSPPDHPLPPGTTPAEIRRYAPEHYRLRRTQTRHTPEGELKPNPDILQGIMREVGAASEQVVYVGDSLMKDVAMAKAAGVLDVWAKYGEAHRREEYELLRRVTHWTADAVKKEKDLAEADVEPTIVLETSFGELVESCRFCTFRKSTGDREKLVVDVWSKTVDVQQHFNDLELRIRNYAVTVLVAIVGASAFALKEGLRLMVLGWTVSAASILLVAGAFAWLAFYLMDRFWYHRLLYGAVKHGLSIERRWAPEFPELSLTKAIGDESPIQLWKWSIRSTHKIDLFYLVVFVLTLGMAVIVQVGSPAEARVAKVRGGGDTAAPTSVGLPIPLSRKSVPPGTTPPTADSVTPKATGLSSVNSP